jgi:hypothetical protein
MPPQTVAVISVVLSEFSQWIRYSSGVGSGRFAYDPPFDTALDMQPVITEHATMPIATIVSFFIFYSFCLFSFAFNPGTNRDSRIICILKLDR